MELTHEVQSDVAIFHLTGKLDTATSPIAQSQLKEACAAIPKKVVVDLQGIDYVASSGLRILLMFSKELSISGTRCIYCELNESVAKVFDVSGFSRILDVRKTLADAMQELQTES